MKLFAHRILTRPVVAEKWLKRAFEGDQTFEDVDGEVYWGRRGSGILFVRNHPEAGWQLLVTLRSHLVDFEQETWGVPGGAVPEDDDSFESAVRETQEEIGSFPSQYRVIDEYVWQAPNGTFTYTTYVVEVLDLSWEEYTLNWEVSDAQWVSMDSAHQLELHPGFSEMLTSMGGQIFGDRNQQDNPRT